MKNTGGKLIVLRRNYSLILIVISGLIILFGCITPFEPKIEKYNNLLVVDGMVTNIPGSCFVRLSRTYPYNQKRNKVEKNAFVKIIDDLDNITFLHDKDDGNYLPEDSTFAGVIGGKYKVSVVTSNGEICESNFEELTEPVDVGNVYFDVSDNKMGLSTVNLFVDTNDPLKKSFFYAWDYVETWEFAVPYASGSIFLPDTKVCYNDVSSRKILIETTRNYTQNRVIKFPLYSIPNTTNRLSIKYSVLVRQYVLSEKTYEFYRELKDINENTGTLFDPTPVSLTGNISSISSPGQPILGNFQVSGASEKRIFIHRDDLPSDWDIPTEYEFCKADLISKIHFQFRIDSLIGKGWAPMDTLIDEAARDTLIGLAITRGCFDCTTNGKIQKPDYWDEEGIFK